MKQKLLILVTAFTLSGFSANAQFIVNDPINVATSIANMRSNISSVSLDEEGINILQFQKSYNAAARVMTALDEAVGTIINNMGVVGR